jgi:hypothetical protein
MSGGHLVVDISGHGFGHLAQAGEVVRALRERRPELAVTVRGDLPEAMLHKRLPAGFQWEDGPLDVGMVNADALTVLGEASLEEYRTFHADWRQRVARQAQELARLAPDVVLADVPYLSLAAAAEAGIRSAALCSLNWADILRGYCGHREATQPILAEMETAYRQADVFLQPLPHMPMPFLDNAHPIGPIAPTAELHRSALEEALQVPTDMTIGLVSLGGIPFELDLSRWPLSTHRHWVVNGTPPPRPDMTALSDLPLDHTEVLAACDVVVTKPGYGTFTEAACNGVDVLYLPRGDWPEEPYLTAWLHEHARARTIGREALASGRIETLLAAMAAQPRPRPPEATGAVEAAAYLEPWLPRA